MPEIVACPFWDAGNGGNLALDPTLDQTYIFLIEWLSEQGKVTVIAAFGEVLFGSDRLSASHDVISATLFGDPLINVYGDEVRFE